MVFLSVGRSFRPLITQTEFSSSRNRISVFEFLLRWFLLDKIIQILLEIRNLAHWICPKMLLHLKILPENFRGGTGFGVFDVRKVGFLIFSSKKSEILFLLDGNPVCVRSGLSVRFGCLTGLFLLFVKMRLFYLSLRSNFSSQVCLKRIWVDWMLKEPGRKSAYKL